MIRALRSYRYWQTPMAEGQTSIYNGARGQRYLYHGLLLSMGRESWASTPPKRFRVYFIFLCEKKAGC